jgi:hypothetical protein
VVVSAEDAEEPLASEGQGDEGVGGEKVGYAEMDFCGDGWAEKG